MRRALLLLLLTGLIGGSASAAAIVISVDAGPNSFVSPLSAGNEYGTPVALAVAWTQTQEYLDQRIRINFLNFDTAGGGTFDAYLTQDLSGSQGSELAHTTFSAPGTEAGWVTVWEHMDLPDGSLYLVIGSEDGTGYGGWSAATDPLVTLSTGVALGVSSGSDTVFQLYSYGTDVNTGYLPSSSWTADTFMNSGNLMFESVPEPSSWILLGSALTGLGLWRRLRSRAK